MELSDIEKNNMISVLSTLIYNNVEDLRNKLINIKGELCTDKYKIMIHGNKNLYGNNVKNFNIYSNYQTISELDDRWCLRSQLYYHLNNTKKINKKEYDDLLNI